MPEEKNKPNNYSNDFVSLLHALFKRKWLVIIGILAVTLISVVLSLTQAKVYRSNGFFQISDPSIEKKDLFFSVASQLLESSSLAVFTQLKDQGVSDVFNALSIEQINMDHFHVMSIQQFKKFSSAFRNYGGFLKYAKANNYLEDGEEQKIRQLVPGGGAFSKLSRESYALTQKDYTNVGQTLMRADPSNYIVGVSLRFSGYSKKAAHRYLTAMGEFVRFIIFYEKFKEHVAYNENEASTMISRYDNYIIRNNLSLELLKKKRDRLMKLPGKQAEQQRAIVESRILDLEQLVAAFQVEKEKSQLFNLFFQALKTRLETPPINGPQVFTLLEELQKEFFKDKEIQDPVVRSVKNTLDIDSSRFQTYFYKTLRFVSGPSMPGGPFWPKKSTFVIFGLFLGTLFFIALALVLEFWERHKSAITG